MPKRVCLGYFNRMTAERSMMSGDFYAMPSFFWLVMLPAWYKHYAGAQAFDDASIMLLQRFFGDSQLCRSPEKSFDSSDERQEK